MYNLIINTIMRFWNRYRSLTFKNSGVTINMTRTHASSLEPYIRIRIAKDIIQSKQFGEPKGIIIDADDRRYVDALQMAVVGHTIDTLPTAIPIVWNIGIFLLDEFGPNVNVLCNIIGMAGGLAQTCVEHGHDRGYIDELYNSKKPSSSCFKFWAKLYEYDPNGKIKDHVIKLLIANGKNNK